MIKIQLRGMRRVTKMIENLSPQMNKEISKGSGQFMKAVKKSAKLRAPKQTGELAESINLTKLKKGWQLTVDSPYGLYQERGFKPHWIHAGLPTKNKSGTVGSALNVVGFVKVSKHTPFVKPALESNLSNLPNILSKSTKQAIKQSR